jgi:hypothetical protein
MRYVITESKLEDVAYRFVLDTLNGMDFRFKKYKEFDFFPKGGHDADNGIEADYAVGEGYHILIGNSLFRSVKDLFNLTDDQTEDAFRRALKDKGIKKIALLHSLDFSEYRDMFPRNESVIKESKLDNQITDYIDEFFDVDDINWTPRVEYDDDGFEYEDENQMVFYVGDYQGSDEGCFYWYSCDYFNTNSRAGEKCPIVSVEIEYKKQLDGYFGDMWHEPFKKWFNKHFELPVKTVD